MEENIKSKKAKKCECKEVISNLKSSLEESNDKYLRLYAEFDNYKKRVQKEKIEIVDNTKISMISSILEMDNDLSIALKNIKDVDTRQGINLIISKLDKFMKSCGVEPIQTEVYDAHVHEVVMVVDVGKTDIIDVVGKGYMINGKPFKYPKVILGNKS